MASGIDKELPPNPASPDAANGTGLDKPLPSLTKTAESNAQAPASILNLSAIPKRKPVPNSILASAPVEEAATLESGTVTRKRFLALSWAEWRNPSMWSRRRKLISAAVVAGVLLLVLIVGLAAGLTARDRASSNLPLPLSHGGPYTGDLTYYNPGLGACGITSSGSDMICAVSHILFDAASTGPDPNDNPLCGLKVRIQRNGKSVDAKIVDRCVGCKVTDLDVSEAVFKRLANLAQGRVKVEWSWLEAAPVTVS